LNFTDAQPPFQLKTTDARELLLVASGMSKPPYNGFFLQDKYDNEEFVLNLGQGLGEAWIHDFILQKNVSTAKYLYFFENRVSSTVTEKYAQRHARDMYAFLRESVRKAGVGENEVLLIPVAYYQTGPQFSEAVYEYVASTILRLMGFYVVRDYLPWGTQKMPDLSAFRTPEIKELIEMLRSRRLLRFGAASDELQLISMFGRVEPSSLLPGLSDFESVVVEVKRSSTASASISQLRHVIYESGDLYDAGFACFPHFGDQLLSEDLGILRLRQDGEISPIFPTEKLARYPSSESQKLRGIQLEFVLGTFKVELLKNLGMQESVELVCKGERLSYEKFLRKAAKLEPETIIDAVESKLAG
jgi:hypothetical protein